MKMVDEKWKLFGIINIFDLFVLCAVVFLIAFTIKWTIIAEDPSFMKAETVHVKCRGIAITPNYIAELIKEGDVMRDAKGSVICKIDKVISSEPAQRLIYVSKDGEKIFSDQDTMKTTILLDVVVLKRPDGLYFENFGNSLTGNRSMNVKTAKYNILVVFTEISEK